MQVREIAHLSALVATHGATLVRHGGVVPRKSVEQYWSASRCRLDRWGFALKDFTSSEGSIAQATSPELVRALAASVIGEIVVSEMLTRTWAAVMAEYDRQRGIGDAEPVARSLMIGHMEARHRALQLLLNSPGMRGRTAIDLNDLRRRAERWTDLLVGYLSADFDVSRYASNAERASRFAEAINSRGERSDRHTLWSTLVSAIHVAFEADKVYGTPNADLNGEIASSILSCFPSGIFDGTGLLRSPWLLRLSEPPNEAQLKIDELFADADEPAPNRCPAEWFDDTAQPSPRRFEL